MCRPLLSARARTQTDVAHTRSYTTFSYTILNTSVSAVSHRRVQQQLQQAGASRYALPTLGDVDVAVTNTGGVTSDVSVLLFAVGPDAGANGNPLRVCIPPLVCVRYGLISLTRAYLSVMRWRSRWWHSRACTS